MSQIEQADFILFVVDGSKELEEEDIKINEKLRGKKVLGIVNKNDLSQVADLTKLDSVDTFINISAKENLGISDMEEHIYNLIIKGTVEDSSKKLVITNVRHKTALEKTKDAINNIFETINMGLPMDLIAVDLKEALDSLSEVTGEISTEDLLDHVFKNFCVGK